VSPLIEVQGHKYVLLTPQLAGIPKSDLGIEGTTLLFHDPVAIQTIKLAPLCHS
jgi:hypothetical protein